MHKSVDYIYCSTLGFIVLDLLTTCASTNPLFLTRMDTVIFAADLIACFCICTSQFTFLGICTVKSFLEP